MKHHNTTAQQEALDACARIIRLESARLERYRNLPTSKDWAKYCEDAAREIMLVCAEYRRLAR